MFLLGERAAAARVRLHAARRAAPRAAGRHRRACPRRGRLREGRSDRRRPCARRAREARRSTSTTTTTTRASAQSTSSSPTRRRPARCCAMSSRELGVELTPEIAEPLYIALVTDTGRFQYTNTTPKSLRLAAELVEAGADVHAGLPAGLRVGRVREAQAARPRARACARARGRTHRRLVSRPNRLRRGRRSRGVLRGDHRLPARGRGSELAALIREPPRDERRRCTESRCARASTSSTSRRSRARSAAAGTARPPASRAMRRSTRSPSSSARDSSRSVPAASA